MAKNKKSPGKKVAASRGSGLSAAQAGRELEELNRVGIALSETHDVERLLALILSSARERTGSPYGEWRGKNATAALPADAERQRAVSVHRTHFADYGIFHGRLLRASR